MVSWFPNLSRSKYSVFGPIAIQYFDQWTHWVFNIWISISGRLTAVGYSATFQILIQTTLALCCLQFKVEPECDLASSWTSTVEKSQTVSNVKFLVMNMQRCWSNVVTMPQMGQQTLIHWCDQVPHQASKFRRRVLHCCLQLKVELDLQTGCLHASELCCPRPYIWPYPPYTDQLMASRALTFYTIRPPPLPPLHWPTL